MTEPVRVVIVRPGQRHVGAMGIGIVVLDPLEATLQFMVGAEPPTRARLHPGERTEVGEWTVRLLTIDTDGRGSVEVEVTRPVG